MIRRFDVRHSRLYEASQDNFTKLLKEYGEEYMSEEMPDDLYLMEDIDALIDDPFADSIKEILKEYDSYDWKTKGNFKTGAAFVFMDSQGKLVSVTKPDLLNYMLSVVDKNDFMEWLEQIHPESWTKDKEDYGTKDLTLNEFISILQKYASSGAGNYFVEICDSRRNDSYTIIGKLIRKSQKDKTIKIGL